MGLFVGRRRILKLCLFPLPLTSFALTNSLKTLKNFPADISGCTFSILLLQQHLRALLCIPSYLSNLVKSSFGGKRIFFCDTNLCFTFVSISRRNLTFDISFSWGNFGVPIAGAAWSQRLLPFVERAKARWREGAGSLKVGGKLWMLWRAAGGEEERIEGTGVMGMGFWNNGDLNIKLWQSPRKVVSIQRKEFMKK